MAQYSNIYDYIESQEAEYQQPISINGWEWNMAQHIQTSFYYKHGRLLNGQDDMTPVKNITRPILNLQYRAEDIDVKDVVLYVDDPDNYHLSFLVKKYHDDVFIPENDLDTFFDEVKEAKIDYGGGLAKKMAGARPENVDLQSIAFCDQTNMLSAPIGIKHFFNPAELKDMAKAGWGDEANGATMSIDDLIELSEYSKEDDPETGRENKTSGAYIEVYEVHGVLPNSFLRDDGEDNEYTRQMHIVGFYKGKDDERRGVILFRKEEKESPFKLHLRDKVYSRALGFGGAEELFEPQVWTNYDIIRMNDMLDSASKVVLKGVGTDLKSRYPNGLQNVDNLQIIELGEGEDLGQIDTTPRSMALFQRSVAEWEQHAQKMGSATDPLMGEPAPSGTPFRSQERQVIEGKGLHEYRKEKFARFLEEVYRDWIIPHIQKEIVRGTKFLTELNTEEMRFVVDKLVTKQANTYIKELILQGQPITRDQVELFKAQTREKLIKQGNKKFVEILKDEFKGKPLRVKVSIAGASKDLAGMTDKMVNIFRQIISNPQAFQQAMQIPEMATTFNNILEYSGITPAIYTGLANPQISAPQQQGGVKPELDSKELQAKEQA